MHLVTLKRTLPEDSQFASLLTGRLELLFRNSSTKPVTVKFELLRKVATQSGVSYPKFYAWVKVYAEGKLLKHGRRAPGGNRPNGL